MSRYSYTAYGLNFASSFPLPELQPAGGGPPDVAISYGDVPDSLAEPSANGIAWQSSPGQMLLSVSEVARYLVLDNREIRVHPLPGTREVDVRTFLFGSVLGALLHARQMLVLHASAVRTERGAVVFMGRSGAGKSMLLAAFLQRGYAMLSDDKAGVVLDDRGGPQIVPGLPQIRLARDAVNTLRYPVNGCQLVHSLDKYVLPVAGFSPTPLGLYAAYSLSAHNRTDIRVEHVSPLDRFQLLNRYTYRRRFMRQTSQRQAHFQLLGAVAGQTRVARVVRPDHPCLIDELRARIEEDLAQ
jgi:hypothetical protein